MTRSATIKALRQQISHQDRTAGSPWPIASLGPIQLDGTLADGGLATGTLYEFLPRASGDFPATLGFSLGILSRILKTRAGHVLWVLPKFRNVSDGALYPYGLMSFGIDPDRIVHVGTPKSQSALWALDEALASGCVAAAVGLLPENDRSYDFTASRRLAMRAARSGGTAFILSTRPAFGMATAAEMRWSVESHASVPTHYTGQSLPGLGAPRWHIEIARSRRGVTGNWYLEWNHEKLSFRLAAPLADRTPQQPVRHPTKQSAVA